ncbi:L-threonate dehydrogenase [Muricoccus radiodurans]|uniref:L-threonate dehydrogenase n=1 Tax=Muricoccus radiodurans TaxID=2231721 RepID=UPI003CE88F22
MAGTACVIGLGAMGWGAAASLLRAGIALRGVDLREEVLDRLTAAGGTAARSPEEGARGADALFVFVVNADQTEAVLFGPDGAASALTPGAVVLLCATMSPARTEAIAGRLSGMGLLPLDAPVSGGAARAERGEMTVMASGAPDAFARADPFLKAVATKVYRLGDAPGAGSRVKMVNQLLAGVHIAAAAEAMALGARAGIDPVVLYEVITNSAGASWMFGDRVPRMMESDPAPRSAVAIFVKDLGIVREAAAALGAEAPMAEAALARFRQAAGAGLGGADDSAVVRTYPGGEAVARKG